MAEQLSNSARLVKAFEAQGLHAIVARVDSPEPPSRDEVGFVPGLPRKRVMFLVPSDDSTLSVEEENRLYDLGLAASGVIRRRRIYTRGADYFISPGEQWIYTGERVYREGRGIEPAIIEVADGNDDETGEDVMFIMLPNRRIAGAYFTYREIEQQVNDRDMRNALRTHCREFWHLDLPMLSIQQEVLDSLQFSPEDESSLEGRLRRQVRVAEEDAAEMKLLRRSRPELFREEV